MRLIIAAALTAATLSSTLAQSPAPLPGLLSKFSTLFQSDFASAAKLAGEIPGLPDGVGQRCWSNGWGPVGQVIAAHPTPLTGKLATDAEARRLLVIALGNLCSNTDCTQVFAEEANATAALTLGVPIPSFNALCAKVPGLKSTPLSDAPAK
jgi:hypothetical protein